MISKVYVIFINSKKKRKKKINNNYSKMTKFKYSFKEFF